VSGGPRARVRALLERLDGLGGPGRVHVRPTREGLWMVGVTGAVMLAAVNTGNNLLYAILAVLLAVLLVSNLLAEWNLRGLSVSRVPPAEVFAGAPATCALMVRNRRRWGRSWTLLLTELGDDGDPLAEGWVACLPPGEEAAAPLRLRFPRRGPQRLGRVRVESAFPFGLMRRWRHVAVPDEVLVFPRPLEGASGGAQRGRGREHADPRVRGGEGDLRGIRPYVPGDPLRDVHWATSARVGAPMVVEREGQRAEEVLVAVDPRAPRELAISRATGELLRHFRGGAAVGLELDGVRFPPRAGEAWRRQLLCALAVAPERP
jgi:uncharacterized protein (DUF58 family)